MPGSAQIRVSGRHPRAGALRPAEADRDGRGRCCGCRSLLVGSILLDPLDPRASQAGGTGAADRTGPRCPRFSSAGECPGAPGESSRGPADRRRTTPRALSPREKTDGVADHCAASNPGPRRRARRARIAAARRRTRAAAAGVAAAGERRGVDRLEPPSYRTPTPRRAEHVIDVRLTFQAETPASCSATAVGPEGEGRRSRVVR